MNISAEEKLMYEVMKAIYASGIPVSFKVSMVGKKYMSQNDLISLGILLPDGSINKNKD